MIDRRQAAARFGGALTALALAAGGLVGTATAAPAQTAPSPAPGIDWETASFLPDARGQPYKLLDAGGDETEEVLLYDGNDRRVSSLHPDLGLTNPTPVPSSWPRVLDYEHDVDGDGSTDHTRLVIPYNATAYLIVQLQAAPGVFAAETTISVMPQFGGRPFVMEYLVGDYTGDGLPDIVAGSGRIWMAEQRADHTWIAPRELTTINGTLQALADINNDGRCDVVVLRPNGTTVTIARQQAGGTIAGTTGFELPINTWKMQYLDLNGDGRTDILFDGGDEQVWLRKANGFWDVRALGLADSATLRAVDVDGDGDRDLLADSIVTVPVAGTPPTESRMRTTAYRRDGTTMSWQALEVRVGGVWVAADLIDDLNGDGAVDILFARGYPEGLGIAFGATSDHTPTIALPAPPPSPIPTTWVGEDLTFAVTAADADGDLTGRGVRPNEFGTTLTWAGDEVTITNPTRDGTWPITFVAVDAQGRFRNATTKVLVKPVARVTGTVTDGVRPLAGITVETSSIDGQELMTTTDANGTFTFTGVHYEYDVHVLDPTGTHDEESYPGRLSFDRNLLFELTRTSSASPIPVTSTADDTSEGSLRQALRFAEVDGRPNTIVLAPGAVHELTCAGGGELVAVTGGELAIIGNGATIRQTCPDQRVLRTASSTLELHQITLTGGDALGSGGGITSDRGVVLVDANLVANAATTYGGGVSAQTVRGSGRIADNVATTGGGVSTNNAAGPGLLVVDNTATGNGGGLYASNVSDVTLQNNVASGRGGGWYIPTSTATTAARVAASGNEAAFGGAIGGLANGTIVIEDSQLTGNIATADGGAIAGGTVTVRRATLSGNTAGNEGGGVEGGVVSIERSALLSNQAAVGGGAAGDVLVLKQSTADGNVATTRGGALAGSGSASQYVSVWLSTVTGGSAPSGALVSTGASRLTLDWGLLWEPSGSPSCQVGSTTSAVGVNLAPDLSCGTDAEDVVGVDPLLGPLTSIAGEAVARAPAVGSPAIDPMLGVGRVCDSADLRGTPRPQRQSCDIGAVEAPGGGAVRALSLPGNHQLLGTANGPAGSTAIAGTFVGVNAGGLATVGAGGSDGFVAKLDAAGAASWIVPLGGTGEDAARGVTVDGAGFVTVVGSFQGSATIGGTPLVSAGGTDGFIARFDPAGATVWVRQLSGPGDESLTGVSADAVGGLAAIGSFGATATFGATSLTATGAGDAVAARLSTTGNVQWTRRLGGATGEALLTVATEPGGQITVGGWFAGTASLGSGASVTATGGRDGLVVRMGSGSALKWWRTATGAGDDQVSSLATTTDGRVVVGGSSAGGVTVGQGPGAGVLPALGATDGLVALLDSTGATQWSMPVGGAGADLPTSVAIDAGGTRIGVVAATVGDAGAAGVTLKSPALTHTVVALRADGTRQWLQQINRFASADATNGVRMAASGEVIVLARTSGGRFGLGNAGLVLGYPSALTIGAFSW